MATNRENEGANWVFRSDALRSLKETTRKEPYFVKIVRAVI